MCFYNKWIELCNGRSYDACVDDRFSGPMYQSGENFELFFFFFFFVCLWIMFDFSFNKIVVVIGVCASKDPPRPNLNSVRSFLDLLSPSRPNIPSLACAASSSLSRATARPLYLAPSLREIRCRGPVPRHINIHTHTNTRDSHNYTCKIKLRNWFFNYMYNNNF